jgi:hypothetical protein
MDTPEEVGKQTATVKHIPISLPGYLRHAVLAFTLKEAKMSVSLHHGYLWLADKSSWQFQQRNGLGSPTDSDDLGHLPHTWWLSGLLLDPGQNA